MLQGAAKVITNDFHLWTKSLCEKVFKKVWPLGSPPGRNQDAFPSPDQLFKTLAPK